jgi:hypothetical protein
MIVVFMAAKEKISIFPVLQLLQKLLSVSIEKYLPFLWQG